MYEVEKKRREVENKITNISRRLQKDGISFQQVKELMQERKMLLSIVNVLVDLQKTEHSAYTTEAQLDLFDALCER